MTSPTLEPYREEMLQRLRQGQSKAEIKKWLEQKHGVNIGRSQFYAYVDHLSGEVAPLTEEEAESPLREVAKPQSILEDDNMRALLVALPEAMQEMTERLAALERTIRTHEHTTLQALRVFQEETLASLKQLQERPAQIAPQASGMTTKLTAPLPVPVQADTLHKIWKRAFWINCVVWGLFELLVVRGWWRSVWAAIVRAV